MVGKACLKVLTMGLEEKLNRNSRIKAISGGAGYDTFLSTIGKFTFFVKGIIKIIMGSQLMGLEEEITACTIAHCFEKFE